MRRTTLHRMLLMLIIAMGSASAWASSPAATQPATRAAFPTTQETVSHLREKVERLASDRFEGRGIGTRGLDLAAEYIASEFRSAGLSPLPGQKDHFQPFQMRLFAQVDPRTTLRALSRPLKLDEDFRPLSLSAQKSFRGGVVFVGYGISSAKQAYDDYAGIDVAGKVVLAMRYEPHTPEGRSRFTGGKRWSEEARLAAKARIAAERGAAALLLANPPTHHHGEGFVRFAPPSAEQTPPLPVVEIGREVADRLLSRASAPDLKTLQARIDADGKPHSMVLTGATASGTVAFRQNKASVANVMAYLPGAGPHADEFIVIGAHYDHLGRGGSGTPAPGADRGSDRIFNGADDNASGTSAMLELAQQLAREAPLPRSLLFVAFTAEEEGLIGSRHFVSHPPVPLAKIVTMINLDMVGRVQNNTLYVGGAGTAGSFDAVLKQADAAVPLQFKEWGRSGFAPSDNTSFALRRIPVLFFHSGTHPDYHRPSDEAGRINYEAMAQVVDACRYVVTTIASGPRPRHSGILGSLLSLSE